MTCNCNCICRCTNLANPSGEPPSLCFDCQIMDGLCSPIHGLPVTTTKAPERVDYSPLTDAQKDAAFSRAIAKLGI